MMKKCKNPSIKYSDKKKLKQFKVGDILVGTTYGNLIDNEFYKVIDKTNDSVKVKKLKKKTISGNSMQGMETYVDSFENGKDGSAKTITEKPVGSKYSKDVFIPVGNHRYARKLNKEEKKNGCWFDYLD